MKQSRAIISLDIALQCDTPAAVWVLRTFCQASGRLEKASEQATVFAPGVEEQRTYNVIYNRFNTRRQHHHEIKLLIPQWTALVEFKWSRRDIIKSVRCEKFVCSPCRSEKNATKMLQFRADKGTKWRFCGVDRGLNPTLVRQMCKTERDESLENT